MRPTRLTKFNQELIAIDTTIQKIDMLYRNGAN